MVKSLVHASRVHESFQSAGEVLRLRDVVARTGFNKGMCFRLLYTLHQCGFLDKVGENHYRLATEVRRRRLYRIGYAAQGRTLRSTAKCGWAWFARQNANMWNCLL